MLQRIRSCFGIENYNELEGVVEADEAFYGGLNKNRHKRKKIPQSQGRACVDKTPVLGLVQREGKLTAVVTKDTSVKSLQPIIKKYIKPQTVLITDDWKGYRNMPEYNHCVIKNYAKQKIYDNTIHTNNIEGAWKIMKNILRDMYNSVSRKYLQIYVDEFVFRYNTREMKCGVRFNYLLLNSNIRTKYKDLIYV
ncbi:IS1595 family transposase [Epilithonimonas mollis]|nr:IS1595 family transposase [Epilithonimonas mollis]